MANALTRHIVIALIAAAVCIVGGCTPECLDLKNSIPRAGFYDYDATTETALTLPSVTIYGIGAPGDSALLRNTSAKLVYLPLRLNVNECRYVIHYSYGGYNDDASNDTVSLAYTPLPQFVSHECGALYFFKLDEVTHTNHLLRNVTHSDTVKNIDVEYLQFFFHDPTANTDTEADPDA